MSGDDPRWRKEYFIGEARRVPADSVVITDDPTACTMAARSMYGVQSPQPVIVVRAGEHFFVQGLDDLDRKGDFWEVRIFGAEWKSFISYGEGH